MLLGLLVAGAPCAEGRAGQGGRLLATGGASVFEGGAGGGIVPWAVIAGYGSEGQWGGSAFATRAVTGDYELEARGLAFGWSNRLELGVARQRLALPTLAASLDLPIDRFRQDVYSAKLRLAGDLVYSPWPQLSLIAQHKRQRDFAVPVLVGARDDTDTDWLLAASKLWLGGAGGYNLLGHLNLRSTRANQAGLLGFGGDRRNGRSLVWEGSLAILLDRHWALGYEYRQKPDNLGFAREQAWQDAFIAWFPNKRVAVVAAWADLGDVASLRDQRGWYLSLQVSR
ncbi:DUF3034 family protein [Lysobacter sp. CAU 1642]|uniref:DUF3034 family protein n=1 Tax=Pseudomarimonas salicorniae TaxID=2933270 RepID=A0ABT0GJG4_9GAMM|nr:DUF3034 family protein [Lysobacter sp. CAU 1642]MCK7594684.1 DUF3034 family protein [Lysobacter sp. CAU 1642]